MFADRERRTRRTMSWRELERCLEAKGDDYPPKFMYLDGVLESMSPSTDHEQVAEWIARLVFDHCVEHDIPASGAGHWTVRNKDGSACAEPDWCCLFDTWSRRRRRPDLALEVQWSRGGIAKLEIYRRLHVPEVWFWKRSSIAIHSLRRDGYALVDRSRFVPQIDLDDVCRFVEQRHAPDIFERYRRRRRPT